MISILKNGEQCKIPSGFPPDGKLDKNSTNPVQNKVVAEALEQVKDGCEEQFGALGTEIRNNADRVSDISKLIQKFTRYDGRTNMYVGDLDDLKENSIYNCNESTLHAPKKFPNWFFVVTFVHISNNGYVAQIAIRMNGPNETTPIAIRNCGDGIWGKWHYIAVQEEE